MSLEGNFSPSTLIEMYAHLYNILIIVNVFAKCVALYCLGLRSQILLPVLRALLFYHTEPICLNININCFLNKEGTNIPLTENILIIATDILIGH